jgi:hypothetical protein
MGRTCSGFTHGAGDTQHRVVFVPISSVDAAKQSD